MIRSIFCALALCGMVPFAAWSQDAPRSGPLRIEITEGVVEPLPMALVDFLPASEAETELAAQVSRVVQSDLESSGLFKFLDSDA
ncbi:MAG: Tol-Pal system protein TolB, partial [Mangrovicoccus sp.]